MCAELPSFRQTPLHHHIYLPKERNSVRCADNVVLTAINYSFTRTSWAKEVFTCFQMQGPFSNSSIEPLTMKSCSLDQALLLLRSLALKRLRIMIRGRGLLPRKTSVLSVRLRCFIHPCIETDFLLRKESGEEFEEPLARF